MKMLPINPYVPKSLQTGVQEPVKQKGTDFGVVLKNALGEVENLQFEADEATRKMMTGGDIDIHQVMLATEKAGLALQMTVQVRNKLIEAYQEISRMQI